MSGRGRGRPSSRSAQEPAAAGSSRRSTRHQQQPQPQNAVEPGGQAKQEPESPEQQQQQQQEDQEQEQQEEQAQAQEPEQAQAPQLQPEAPMASASALYDNQVIDPAIAGPQDAGGMLPPPVPGAKGLRGPAAGPQAARRGIRRAEREPSMAASVNSIAGTDAFSSQAEPHSTAPHAVTPAPMFGASVRGSSVASSRAADTPSKIAGRTRLMAGMLPRLLAASEDLFAQLCAGQEDPEMWEVERQGYKAPFDAYRSHFVLDVSSPVVDAGFVADSMRLDRSSEEAARVFRIMSAANLASLLDEITQIDAHRDVLDLLPLFQEWDAVFPDSFLGAPSDTIGNDMSGEIIEHILMIRTQLSIFTLEKLKTDSTTSFHPLECVARIWCDGDVSGDMVHAFLSNNKDGLQLKPILDADSEAATLASDRAATRFDSICKMLPNQQVDGYNLDLTPIHELYPLDEFLANLRTSFITECFARIRTLLHQGSGAGFAVLGPSGGSSRADSQIRSQLETESMAHPFSQTQTAVPHVSYNASSLRMMKQLEQQGAYGDGHPLPASSYAPAPRIPYPPGFGPDSPSLGYGEPPHQAGFPADGSLYADSAAKVTSKKRRAAGEPSTAGEGTASAPAKKPRSKRKRSEASGAAIAAASVAALASTVAASGQVAPSQYPPLPGTQDEPDLEAISQRSKEVTAAARKVKEPQSRQAWLREDVNQLIRAIHTYQCKWSTIEKEIKNGTIAFQRPRDQQALRDKARLLKQDILKTDCPLPRSFDLVVLGKKERDAVMAVGKNPGRKEADVDERGQPVNTEIAPEDAGAQAHPPAPPPAEPQPEPQPEAEPQASAPEPAAA